MFHNPCKPEPLKDYHNKSSCSQEPASLRQCEECAAHWERKSVCKSDAANGQLKKVGPVIEVRRSQERNASSSSDTEKVGSLLTKRMTSLQPGRRNYYNFLPSVSRGTQGSQPASQSNPLSFSQLFRRYNSRLKSCRWCWSSKPGKLPSNHHPLQNSSSKLSSPWWEHNVVTHSNTV